MFVCNFCNRTLSKKGALVSHQLKTKYCLEIQRTINPNQDIILVKCQFCTKGFTHKHQKTAHELTCKIRYDLIIDDNISKIKKTVCKT